jgi:DNA-binding transcriptional regulator YiaG
MANVHAVLKDEIRRVAKKEIKAETGSTRQAVSQYRRDIARLKRQVQALDRAVRFLKDQESKRVGKAESTEGLAENTRFSPRSVRAQRQRIGFSAADYAKLVGVSPLTIYNWEHGKSRPKKAQMAKLVALRGIGKREALAKLELVNGQAKPNVSGPRKRGRRKAK